MPRTAFEAAVAVLCEFFKTTDGTPVQLTAIDLRHLAQSLFSTLPPRSVGDALIRQLLLTEELAVGKGHVKEDLLAECERILFNTELTQIRNAKLVAACLYFHYTPRGA